MKHFAIFIADLESERFLSASDNQIATWLYLHALCSKQMNGGTIACAATIPERFWSRHGIDHNILCQPSPLWVWDGDSLIVRPYDIDGQTLYEKKSKGGKSGAEKRWKGTENRTPNGTPNAPDQTRPDQTLPNLTSPDDSSGDELEDFFSQWNQTDGLPKVAKVTAKRKQHLKARLKDQFFRDHWKQALAMIPSIPFLTGNNDRRWKADVDWFLKPDSVVVIIEGKYGSQSNTAKPTSTPSLRPPTIEEQ